jgi:putative membrane protein insertion efficiency factor
LPTTAKTWRHAPRLFGRGLIKAYRYMLSPLVGFDCRHRPTCSEYADQAVERYGLWAGSWMTLARLLRCQPWGTAGLDFVRVPSQPGPLFGAAPSIRGPNVRPGAGLVVALAGHKNIIT